VKRAGPILLVLVVALVLGVWLARRGSQASDTESATTTAQPSVATDVKFIETTVAKSSSPGNGVPLLGETILHGYANTNLPPENDLTLLSRLMENSLLLLKSAANRPLSANEDWADLLCGKNAAQERFLPEQHAALNTKGQIIDRWGTPLFFHALGGGRYELRSAGPDKKMWTTDDFHRNADGSFRRGAELNSPSLLETATRGRSPSTAP